MAILPVHSIQHEIISTLQSNNRLILQAPTGSGKSTLVPQYVADHVVPPGKKVIVLQPRRMAARMLATFIARERKTALGDEVGYRVRLEGKWSDKTTILFYTEGILLQRLIKNDRLNDIGALIFDEFHERHIETDICISLAVQLQKTYRPDLKIIVMSATLETTGLQAYLENCKIIKAEGRAFPVNIVYKQPKPHDAIWDFAADTLALAKETFKSGSVLVFMPGSFEIKKTIEAIRNKPAISGIPVFPLYGSLTKVEQDRALEPGEQKIIVSTNVAETSLTIPGISLVIDSGLARISRFDVRRGINTLFTEAISKSSAQQRAGRAGRLAPGNCIRLWSEFSHENRAESDTPEIHRIDLSEVILGLLDAGYNNPHNFPWFEKPDNTVIDNALQLLEHLGAIDHQLQLTETGKNMARFSMHPRFSRMLTESLRNNCFAEAAVVAAITQSTGIFYPTQDEIIKNERNHYFGNTVSDLIFEFNAWLWAGSKQFRPAECKTLAINASVARQIAQLAIQIMHHVPEINQKKKLPSALSPDEETRLRKCIFAGFSDLIAVRHSTNSATCKMMNGKSGQLHTESMVKSKGLLVATELEESKTPTGIKLFLKKVTQIEESWLNEITASNLIQETEIRYDSALQKVVKITDWNWNGLVLKRETSESDNPEENSKLIAQAILEKKIDFPQWNEEAESFIRRVNFASKHCPHYGIPEINGEAIEFILQQAVYGCKTNKEVAKCNIWPALKGWLSYEQQAAVDLVAPETIELPHRRKPVKLRYNDKGDVILSETIQALYDCPLPVTVAEGKVQVIFELLAPSRRPVQITRDLEYFWKNSYHEIKKELKGRYPKHEWR